MSDFFLDLDSCSTPTSCWRCKYQFRQSNMILKICHLMMNSTCRDLGSSDLKPFVGLEGVGIKPNALDSGHGISGCLNSHCRLVSDEIRLVVQVHFDVRHTSYAFWLDRVIFGIDVRGTLRLYLRPSPLRVLHLPILGNPPLVIEGLRMPPQELWLINS
ncbi:hypothetical protein BD779DRAFT_268020 [Infundibulicybe gibba]|nr:hypothetical protein BD779DRAFT_268020 [Infundibulicybe gibba]